MKSGTLKSILKWFILGSVFFFLAQALRANWQDIAAIRNTKAGMDGVGGATGITILAHIW